MKTGKFGRYFMAMLLTGSLLTACSPEIDVRTSPGESDLAVEAPSTIDPLPPKIQQTNLVQKQPIPDWVNIGPLPEFPEESLDLIKNGIAYIAERSVFTLKKIRRLRGLKSPNLSLCANGPSRKNVPFSSLSLIFARVV